MILIHEIHVLELQMETNVYDPHSFQSLCRPEFFRPFSLLLSSAKNSENYTHSFQLTVLIHEFHVLTSNV